MPNRTTIHTMSSHFAAGFLILVFALAGQTSAQDGGLGGLGGGLGGGGGGVDSDVLTDQIIDAVDDGGGVGGGVGGGLGTGGGVTTGGNGADFDEIANETFNQQVEVPTDERNARGFIGVSSEDADSVLMPDGFRFVGANRDSVTLNTTNPGGGGPGGGGGGAQSINVSDGIFINRTNPTRARLVPRFRSPNYSPNFVSGRVNQRLSALPSTRSARNSMNVVMQGSTAIIRGNAQNREQMMRIARQLRLEPGVSRVVSQVSVNRR